MPSDLEILYHPLDRHTDCDALLLRKLVARHLFGFLRVVVTHGKTLNVRLRRRLVVDQLGCAVKVR